MKRYLKLRKQLNNGFRKTGVTGFARHIYKMLDSCDLVWFYTSSFINGLLESSAHVIHLNHLLQKRNFSL